MEIVIYILIGLGIIFIALGLSIANFSGNQLYSYYKEQLNDIAYGNLTAADFCARISELEFDGRIRVSINDKIFGGAYSPSRQLVELSSEVYNSGSVSAIAVTAHELGHALQNKQDPNVLRKNFRFSKVIKVLGKLIFPIFLAAIVLFFLNYGIISLILAGVCLIFFILALALKVSTIKIEKQASKLAMQIMGKMDILTDEQLAHAKKLLKYAGMTYTAEFFSALLFWTFLTKKAKIF